VNKSTPSTRKPSGRQSAARKRPAAAPDAPARERILHAALEVFAERGFEGARTRDIAARADVNLGLLSYYFGEKEKLWRESVALAFDELAAEVAAIGAPTGDGAWADERARLEQLLRGVVRFLARRPAFMRLMNDESRRDGPRMRWLVQHHVKPLAAALEVIGERAQARGILPDIPPASLHYIVVGAAGLLFSQAPECRYLMGVDPADPAVAEAHADALVRVLLGPPATAETER
jgi:AcrR family transcriptional regulator